MKAWKIITIVTLAIAAAALLTSSAYGYISGQGMMGNYGAPTIVASNNGYYSGGMMGGSYGGGMMGSGYGYYPSNTVPTQSGASTTTLPTSTNDGAGCGNHGTAGPVYAPNGTPLNAITTSTAVTNAQNYLTILNNPDLKITQVEEYSQNFYAQVAEKSTGVGAFELLINKYTGVVGPEMGPNMMWNTKYGSTTTSGMMGGMMNGYAPYAGTPTVTMPITVTQAKTNAQQFLSTNNPGTTTGEITTFYGYYTIEILSNGSSYGMISVNGYSGQVWYHTWHGTFVQELEVS